MDEDAYPLALVVETVDASLDAAVICRAAAPFGVLHVSDEARHVLSDLDSDSADVLGRMTLGAAIPTVGDIAPAGLEADLAAMFGEVADGGERIDDIIDVRGSAGALRAYLACAIRRVGPFLVWTFRTVESDDVALGHARPGPSVDALTGLATRSGIRAALESCLERLEVLGEGFALEFLDIDGLAGINSRYGRRAGDLVLWEMAQRMRSLVRGSDTVGRVSEDEFVIVWPGVGSAVDVRRLHDRICESVHSPISLGPHEVLVTISAGAVFINRLPDCDPDDLLRDADTTMREAKAHGGGGFLVAEHVERIGRSRSFVTASELIQALHDDEFVLYAQPLVDVHTGRTAGAEMLVRWYHPERGLLNPIDFMPAAESAGVMDELGAWVIDRAVAQAAAWEQTVPLDYFRVGINVWPWQLMHSDVAGQLRDAAKRHGTTCDNFVIEVIESQELESRTRAARQLQELLELGARVGIDDFGSGFANMSYLRDLPVDLIKVDRALVGRQPTRREEAILQAISSIAEVIGADVVLEGVERIPQLEAARRCGVTFAQGYLVGRPILAGVRPPRGRFPLPPVPRPSR